MSQGYDFGALYGMADHSASAPLPEGNYDAIVEDAEWGRTKDGTKGAWTIKFRTTSGERPGYPLTMTLSVNPTKQGGDPNPQGMGIMFRQLHAMGVPVGPPHDQPGVQPFWALGWTPEQVASVIKGRPVQIRVKNDEFEDTLRSKVRDIKLARPGAPTSVPQQQQAQYGQPQTAYQPGYAEQYPGQYQQPQQNGYGYGQPPAQQPYGGYPGQQAPAPQPQQFQGPVAPGPWQGAQSPAAAPQQQVPGVPAWAQPGGGVPGQGGMGEFTGQGASQQPWQQGMPQQGTPQQQQPPPGWHGQAPQPQFQQPGYPPQQPGGYAQPGGAPQGTPPGAPGTTGASPSYQQGPPQQQPQQQQPGAPELPPWAQ